MENYLYIALFAPLVSSLFAALFAQKPKIQLIGIITTILIGISLMASVTLLLEVAETGKAVHATLMDWIQAGNMDVKFGFTVDQVTAVMMSVVTLVSTVVHAYSNYYMESDKSFNRFFSYLSAFVFSMMILVMSDNFLGLFNPSISPSWAANEAFIMNRIADLGMLVGIFLIYWNLGTLKYSEVFAHLNQLSHTMLVGIGIALFIGAMGKSAQFPLHTWLADAMEGPTPVSALIHAATMVTAGVYLVIRANPLYSQIPDCKQRFKKSYCILYIISIGLYVCRSRTWSILGSTFPLSSSRIL